MGFVGHVKWDFAVTCGGIKQNVLGVKVLITILLFFVQIARLIFNIMYLMCARKRQKKQYKAVEAQIEAPRGVDFISAIYAILVVLAGIVLFASLLEIDSSVVRSAEFVTFPVHLCICWGIFKVKK